MLKSQLAHSYIVGTKNGTKELKKITDGTKKDGEIKWFSELSDKRMSASFNECMYSCGVHQLGKSIKVHLYWAM